MLKFLKVVLLLFLVASLIAVASYIYLRDNIFEKAKTYISRELSSATGLGIEIGSMGYTPFQTLSLYNIEISGKAPERTHIISISELNVTLDLPSLIANKRLSMIIGAERVRYGKITLNAFSRARSREIGSYRDIFSLKLPELVDTLELIDANLKYDAYSVQKAHGTLDLASLDLTGGKLYFVFREKPFVLSFSGSSSTGPKYEFNMRSQGLDIEGLVAIDDGDLGITGLSGTLYTAAIRTDVKIRDFASADRQYEFSGSVKTTLKDAASYRWKYSGLLKSYGVDGDMSAIIDLKMSGSGASQKYDIKAGLKVDNLAIKDVRVESLSASLSGGEKALSISSIDASLYGGNIRGSASLDLSAGGLPRVTSVEAEAEGIDLPSILTAIDGNRYGISGRMKTGKGAASTIDLKIRGSGAALEYDVKARAAVNDLAFKNIKVDSLSMSLAGGEKALSISSIDASLYGGNIRGSASIDLAAGKLTRVTSVEMEAKGMDLAPILLALDGNRYAISGRTDGDILLKYAGESGEPLPGPITNTVSALNALGRYAGVIDISASGLRIGNTRLEAISGGFFLKDGMLRAPSISGRLYGGTMEAECVMDLDDTSLPYNLSFGVKNININQFASDLTRKKSKISGAMDSELSLEGYAKDIQSVAGTGDITVRDANLGPMPLLAPLIGDFYSNLEYIFNPSSIMSITSADCTLTVGNREISTRDMALWGTDIYITASGDLDFDGNLDFSFQNQMRDPESEANDTWQNVLKTSIVKFGRYISKGRLKGTLKEPKWEFEYLFKDIISENIKSFLRGVNSN